MSLNELNSPSTAALRKVSMIRAIPKSAILAAMPVVSSTLRAEKSRCIMGGRRYWRSRWREPRSNSWWSTIRHPRIVQFLGVCSSRGRGYTCTRNANDVYQPSRSAGSRNDGPRGSRGLSHWPSSARFCAT